MHYDKTENRVQHIHIQGTVKSYAQIRLQSLAE